MKRILYGLFLFISAFFFIDNVSALGFGSNYVDFDSKKEELATMYVNNGNFWVSFYGYNGSGSECGTAINSDPNAPLECWQNGTLSYVLDDTTYEGYYMNSLRLSLNEPMETGKYYRVTINYTINSTSYSSIKDWFRINDYPLSSFSSTCNGLDCKIEFVMRSTMTKPTDLDDLWLNFSNSTTTFTTFRTRIARFFAPQVEEIKYTPPTIPSGEDVVNFDTNNSKLISTYNDMEDKLEEILDTLKNNNPKNHRYVVWLGQDSNGSFVSVNLLPSSFSSFNTATNYEYCYLSAFKYSNVYYNAGGCYTKSTGTKRYTFRSDSSISSLKSDLALAFSSISGTTSGSNTIQHSYLNQFNFVDNEYDYFSNNNYFILPYASTEPIYNYNSSTGSNYYHIKFGDNELSFDSTTYLEPSDNYLDLDYEVYTLSNIEYSAIEVIFDINDFPMVDNGNNINLDYFIQLDNKMIIPLLPIPQEKIYRSMASSDYEIGTTLNLLFDEKANEYSSRGVKTYKYWNSITYRFEFPFTSDYVGNITLKVRSDSPYTIKLESRTNEENDIKYDELDLTGKYGVGFIPKVSTLDVYNDFYGIFKIPYQNNYRLMFYESYERQNLIIDKTLLSLENYEYKFTKKNVNSYLLFINNNFKKGSNASILYNSNYFNYCILDDSISTCDIVNPNNNENVSISPNLSDLDNFGLKNIFNSFLSFSNSTNFILDNVTNFYNNFLPKELQTFFFISFGFVVIIIITKIVL